MLHLFSTIDAQKAVSPILHSDNDRLYCIQDYYTDGLLQIDDDKNLYAARVAYAIEVGKIKGEQSLPNDVDMLMQVSTKMSNDASLALTYWMTGNTQDVLVYFMLLHYLKKQAHKIHIINIAGLPFLNEQQQLFFPTTIGELPEKELQKCLKLTRSLSATEIELDSDEWLQIVAENAALRILDGNKKIKGLPDDYYDATLQTAHKEDGKIATTVNKVIKKNNVAASPEFLTNRLTQILNNAKVSQNASNDESTPIAG